MLPHQIAYRRVFKHVPFKSFATLNGTFSPIGKAEHLLIASSSFQMEIAMNVWLAAEVPDKFRAFDLPGVPDFV